MPWARLDDAFYTHRKVIDLTPAARWLYVAGLCYCNQNLTDGAISTSAALSIGMIPSPKRAIGELVKAGLWTRHEGGGYQVHDYLVYQLSREQILKAREAAARRQDRLRRGKNGRYGGDPPDDEPDAVSHGVTDGVTNADGHDVNPADVTTAPCPYPPSGLPPQTTSSGRADTWSDERNRNSTPSHEPVSAEVTAGSLIRAAEATRQERAADAPTELDVDRGKAHVAAARAALLTTEETG